MEVIWCESVSTTYNQMNAVYNVRVTEWEAIPMTYVICICVAGNCVYQRYLVSLWFGLDTCEGSEYASVIGRCSNHLVKNYQNPKDKEFDQLLFLWSLKETNNFTEKNVDWNSGNENKSLLKHFLQQFVFLYDKIFSFLRSWTFWLCCKKQFYSKSLVPTESHVLCKTMIWTF